MILHGSGSDSTFVRAAFKAPLASLGLRLVAPDDRTGDPVAMANELARIMTRYPDVRVVGGVSVGAHAVARWAARDPRARGLAGLLFVLPAWTGRPDRTAAMTKASARALAREGVHTELLRIGFDDTLANDWVVAELRRAWPRQADTLPDSLLRTASSRGPYISELARISAPAGIVMLADDPLHPTAVAQQWQRALPNSTGECLNRHAPAADRSVIGAAAVSALARARARQLRTTQL